MRKYITLFFSVFPFLFACHDKGAPDGIISPAQMTALMTQVYIIDGRLSAYQQLPDTLYKYGTGRYLALFKQFHTDSAQFRKSYVYYSSRPKELLDMNVIILADLQNKTDSLNKLVRKQQEKKPNAAAVISKPALQPGAQPSAVATSPVAAGAKQQPASPSPATGKPVSTFHPSAPPGASNYGVGVQAPAAAPKRVLPIKPNMPSGHMQRFRAKRDSILKAKMKNAHGGSN